MSEPQWEEVAALGFEPRPLPLQSLWSQSQVHRPKGCVPEVIEMRQLNEDLSISF